MSNQCQKNVMHDKKLMVSHPIMGELEFRRFQKLIFESAGIHLAPSKRSMVEGRLAKRVTTLNLPDFVSYVRYVDSHAEEHQLVIDLLTTNETYFFRETKHFDFLANDILARWPSGRDFNVWSAACSTGEEAYSVAMTLAEGLGKNNWKIMASDISRRVLKRASAGLYPINRMENMPTEYLKKYCLRGVDAEAGNLLIERRLRQKIEFRQVNLSQTLPKLPKFDLILLRNVMIYFSSETKNAVVQRVAECLKEGGHLFISHSESLNGMKVPFEQVAPAIYRKISS